MTRAKQTPPSASPPAPQAPPTAPTLDGADGEPQAPTAGADGEARRSMIAAAAYYRAERRGFADGQAEEDWFAAEQEVELLLNGRITDTPS